jgi:hypothetical protein
VKKKSRTGEYDKQAILNYAGKIQMRIYNADQEMKMTNLSINSTPSLY